MKNRVHLILFIGLFSLFTTEILAFTIEGRVKVEHNSPHILLDGKLYPLLSSNFDIQTDINKLKSGDFISGTGKYSSSKNQLYMDSINSVGLIDILGIWHTSKWDVFEFLDFSHLNLYVSRINMFGPTTSLFGFKPIRYSISPGFTAKKWSILLVDPMGIKIGSLSIEKGKWLEIEILDQSTGAVIQKVSLSKFKNSLKDQLSR